MRLAEIEARYLYADNAQGDCPVVIWTKGKQAKLGKRGAEEYCVAAGQIGDWRRWGFRFLAGWSARWR
jgi:hypothetical protein